MGILDDLNNENNKVEYKPLTLDLLKNAINDFFNKSKPEQPGVGGKPFKLRFDKEYHRGYNLFTGRYGMAIYNDDKEQIAYYEKLHRANKFLIKRKLIEIYGPAKARVIAILNKRVKSEMTLNDKWMFSKDEWSFAGFDKYSEMASVQLQVEYYFEDHKDHAKGSFSITVVGYEDYGKHYSRVIRSNIPYGSLLKIIDHVSLQLTNGMIQP